MLPLLKFAADGAEYTTNDAAKYLAVQFGLSESEKKKLLPTRKQAIFTNRVTLARSLLTKAGLQEACGEGVFRNTPHGQQVLEGDTPETKIPYLKKLAEANNKKTKKHDTPPTGNPKRTPTYLLTWKPSRAPWRSPLSRSIDDSIRKLHAKGFCDLRWSCGRSKRIEVDARVFLFRQGSDRPGIIASGQALCEPYEGDHWDKTRPGEKSRYILVRADSLLNADTTDILRREDLDCGSASLWNTQASGIAIPPDVAVELERRWSAHLRKLGQEPVLLTDEIAARKTHVEGNMSQVPMSRYERSGKARRECIEHYGLRCSVCDFDFEAAYGERGRGYIHVQHIVLMCEGRQRRTDPIADLRPICPNCHAMIHRRGKTITIEALRKLRKEVRALRSNIRG